MSNSPAAAIPEIVPIAQVNAEYLESLLGYNAQRAALVIIELFLQRMALHKLRPVEFSVLSPIAHNSGITSCQLCGALILLPPNLVFMIVTFEKRRLIVKRPHPSDGRANGLHPTPAGEKLIREPVASAKTFVEDATTSLTAAERKTLITLLKKVYREGCGKWKNGARDGT